MANIKTRIDEWSVKDLEDLNRLKNLEWEFKKVAAKKTNITK